MATFRTTSAAAIGISSALSLAACGGDGGGSSSARPAAAASSLVSNTIVTGHPALPGYKLSLWATGTSDYTKPDSIAVDGSRVYVGFQNITAKDGSDNKTSTVVEFTLDGKPVRQWATPGHNDGVRVDPTTHVVWATGNEDGNPSLVTIDPGSATVTPYTFPKTPHDGGYDDLAFVNGMTFIAASNPTLDASGNNIFPAVDRIELVGSQAKLTPVLMGNATATDTATNKPVTLNETDPDSMSITDTGALALIDQGSSEIVFLTNPGTPQQSVTRTSVGDQLDDTVWAKGNGKLLISDGASNAIYQVTMKNTLGGVITQAPDDSAVAGFIGTVNLDTGFITPVIIGFGKPTGMAYLPPAG